MAPRFTSCGITNKNMRRVPQLRQQSPSGLEHGYSRFSAIIWETTKCCRRRNCCHSHRLRWANAVLRRSDCETWCASQLRPGTSAGCCLFALSTKSLISVLLYIHCVMLCVHACCWSLGRLYSKSAVLLLNSVAFVVAWRNRHGNCSEKAQWCFLLRTRLKILGRWF